MKSYITDNNGRLITSRLITLFIGLTLISYIISFSWNKPDINISIKEYVENTNNTCPIEHSNGVFLDSVSFDGNLMITHYISSQLMEISDDEFIQMKKLMIQHTKARLIENEELIDFVIKYDVKFKYHFLNLSKKVQNFEFILDKSMIEKIDH